MPEDRINYFELEIKLSQILNLLYKHDKALTALGELLVEADYVTKAKRLNAKTISQNKLVEKFNGLTQRKILMKLSEVNVVKQRKSGRKAKK